MKSSVTSCVYTATQFLFLHPNGDLVELSTPIISLRLVHELRLPLSRSFVKESPYLFGSCLRHARFPVEPSVVIHAAQLIAHYSCISREVLAFWKILFNPKRVHILHQTCVDEVGAVSQSFEELFIQQNL